MCGIAGVLGDRCGAEALTDRAMTMASVLEHRGPDDAGSWTDERAGLALGFRRLAIIDLSDHGHQPIASASARNVLVFNGEIYNFREIRSELEARGTSFHGSSDSEVLVEAIDAWGVSGALERANGMFAFAVWNRDARTLSLARDRLGEKPLYYGWFGGTFLFGSTVEALRRHPSFRQEVDRDALALFLRHGFVPSPYCIYDGVAKLPPGTWLSVAVDALAERPRAVPYWSAREAAEHGMRDPLDVSLEEAVDLVERCLGDSVGLRMVADVPIGAFLSGGIDSSTVAALMQARSAQPVKTFSIGFDVPGYDEAAHGAQVARHLGTDHTEMYVSADDAMAVIPRLPEIWDEPFADSSQIPTHIVSRLARRDVTVALSGDGGDELFGGYTRYRAHEIFSRRVRRVPLPIRSAAARALTSVSAARWDAIARRGERLTPRWSSPSHVGDKLHKAASMIAIDDPREVYLRLMSDWDRPAEAVRGGGEKPTVFTDPAQWPQVPDTLAEDRFLDTVSYLPDDILVKVDRASMAVGLEARVPMLDHRLVELAWRLPRATLRTNGTGKVVLRGVLDRHVPQSLVDRPKMGFGLPIGGWLRGPLRAWAEDLLAPDRLRREGFFHVEQIERCWREHVEGSRDWKYKLWNVLMFQAWLERR